MRSDKGQQADFHGAPPKRTSTTATIRLVAGMKNRRRNDSRHAVRKQIEAMEMPPMISSTDAICVDFDPSDAAMEKRMVTAEPKARY